jgi:hypothetical protein
MEPGHFGQCWLLSQLPRKGALEEGLFEFGEGVELALVDGFEAAGFGREGVEFLDDGFLLVDGRKGNYEITQSRVAEVLHHRATSNTFEPFSASV